MCPGRLLSARGAFALRRNSKQQATANVALAAITSQMALPNNATEMQQQQQPQPVLTPATDCHSKQQQQQLHKQLQKPLNTQFIKTPQHLHASLSPVGVWLVFALLAAIVASTEHGAAAVPRRMSGRHLILPHRHHVHHRSASEAAQQAVPQPYKERKHCRFMEQEYPDVLRQLRDALNTTVMTQLETQDMLNEWLQINFRADEETMTEAYKYWKFNLTHPLRSETEAIDAYDFITNTQELQVELPKILDTLSIMYELLVDVGHERKANDSAGYRNYFRHFPEKIQHNIHHVSGILGVDNCPTPPYTYNRQHILKSFAVVREALLVLRVVEAKYRVLLAREEARALAASQ